MASKGATALGSSASLTITAVPAPVNYRQTLVEDLAFIWDLITFQPFQKTVTGGVLATHQSVAAAELTAGLGSASGPKHHALADANLMITETPSGIGFGEYYNSITMTINVPLQEENYPVELTYFNVWGNWYDVEDASLIGGSTTPTFQVISAFVTFWPGYIDANGATHAFDETFTTEVENLDLGQGIGYDTSLALAPRTGRILNGQLETIDQLNATGMQLVANSDILNLAAKGYDQLIYNVQFTNVIYAGNARQLANFAFIAPTDDTALSITDPGLARLPYGGPV